jgi:hypothetical protein
MTTKNTTTNEEWQEVKTSFVKWGKVGDNIEGTLIDVRETTSQLPGKEGEMQKIYDIKSDRGSYHDLDAKKNAVEPAIIIEANEIYSVGGRTGIDAQMRRIVVGQKVRFIFTEEKPAKTKGYNDLKIIKVMTNGKMDQEWLEGREVSVKDL